MLFRSALSDSEYDLLFTKDKPILFVYHGYPTLIHELTHCYIDNYITHCKKQYSEEDVADIVANSYDIIHEIVNKYFEIENKCK